MKHLVLVVVALSTLGYGNDIKVKELGKTWFEDASFSSNGKVSCASCHDPDSGFVDGKKVAEGIFEGIRNTPQIANVDDQPTLFWDGRERFPELQALAPIENPREHNITRARVAQLIYQNYLPEYEEAFGPYPSSLKTFFAQHTEPFEATFKRTKFAVPSDIAKYVYRTVRNRRVKDRIDEWRDEGFSLAAAVSFETKFYDLVDEMDPQWSENYRRLSFWEKGDIDEVFYNFGRALAAFERGIVLNDSPYDRYLEENSLQAVSERAIPGFGEKELAGLKIFEGKGGCANCHSGKNLSDGRFHNIGLGSADDYKLDLGRATGLLQGFFCIFVTPQHKDKCDQIETAIPKKADVGAFRTPSLRNVAKTAPYMHDGRFKNLKQVMRHYALRSAPEVGERDKLLKPVRLSDKEEGQLEAFLRSLSSGAK
jgi:cytochrome c peroxidase